MTQRIPIGVSDFRELREQGLVYVDKSHLIREMLDKGAQTFLLPRPRRFGKTLNLSMLRCFFEKRDEDLSPLFSDLSIWQAGDAYRAHFQRYPVIFVTFKDVKAPGWDTAWEDIRQKLRALVDQHRYLLESQRLSPYDREGLRAILDGTADRAGYATVLLNLCRCLHSHHGRKVVVLIDEYDAPIHAGWAAGYGAEVIAFFRSFLNAGLKDNAYIFKGVVTGILRIAKESIFSDLNHLAVHSMLARDFSTCFGFTEPEVVTLLQSADLASQLDTVRAWYNGYVFGGTVIYNPWSILNFIDNPAHQALPYWLTTSSNELIRESLQRYALTLQPALEALLDGTGIERRVDESVVLSQLGEDQDTLWSLLLFSGYLKAEDVPAPPGIPMESPRHRLTIPNLEVREVYTSTFRRWLEQSMKGHGGDVELLTRALLAGDAEALEEQLQAFTVNLLSYHDTAIRPEQVYHAFVIGLLATLEPAYEVRSNRESGHGRPDVLIKPRHAGGPGVVLKLKVAKRGKKTLAQALAEGVAQIRDQGYAAELLATGVTPVHALAVAFDGKRVRVRDARVKRTRRTNR
jgi:hypothetical protein